MFRMSTFRKAPGRHRCRSRALLLAGLAILVALAVAGCPYLGGVIGFIKLQIDPTGASKGITLGDFEVTGLDIQVRDLGGEVLKSIEWDSGDGPRFYLIPVKEPGEHEIDVTHYGKRDGEAVEALDTAVFDVPARDVTIVDVVPGCIGVIRIED